MTTSVTVPYTFLPLRFFLPELIARLRAELGAAVPIVGLIDGLLQIEFPSPAPDTTTGPELGALDVVGFTDLSVRFDGTRLAVEGVLDVLPGYEPQFHIPAFDKLSIVINRLGIIRLELDAEGAQLTVTGPAVALRFDPTWLRPVAADTPNAFAEIELVELGYLTFDSHGNIDFGAVPGGQLRFVTNNDPWRIGDSSVTLETGELDVILRSGPEGGPAVTLTDAVLRFSQDLAAKDGTGFELALAGARIDGSGFTGTVSARFPDTVVDDPQNPRAFVGSGAASLFGFEFGVNSIDLEFRSNVPVRCAIAGGMILPFFEEAVSCTLSLSEGGDFRVAFADVDGDGLVQFTKPDVCRLALTAFDLSRAEGVTTLSLSGELEMLRAPDEVGTVPKLTIKGLTIDSRGQVSLKAGWVELNPAVTFDLIGFLLTIQRLGIGFDPGSLWVGITGGITLVNGLPRATVEELRLIFSLTGGSPSVALRGATIDADIGGTIQLFGGFRMLPKDQGVEGFAGDVRLSLSSGFGLDGSVLVGINTVEGYPFLYVFIGVELPAGIPLPPSGCALFGFAGLFGMNVAPSRLPGQNWYYDWYRGPPGPGVTQSTKWRPQEDAFALGAGITIGTQDGYTIVVRALLVVTLPSFTILIEGRAGFLTERAKLGENPVLRALIVFDPDDSILFALEAQYEFVQNVLFAHGVVEGYFPFHSGAWHVYLGERPANRRIIADVLKKLFRADAYVMIDGSQTQFGGSIGYSLDRRFGPARVRVRAGLSGDGVFSYDPTQLEAVLALFGSLRLSAFGVSVGADLDADITVRVPTPYLLSLHFKAKINLCWPLDDIKVEFDVRWEEDVPPPYPAPLLADATALFNVSSETIALSPGQVPDARVPLDARFALNFSHALSKPTGGAFPRILDFPETFLHQVSPLHTFRYSLASLRLERLNATGGVVETLDLNDSSSPLFGHWQLTPAGQGSGIGGPAPADSSRAPGGTLMLLARTPFEYLQSVSSWSDGTTAPADVPAYEPVAEDPPTEKHVDVCDEIGSPSGDDGSLPGDGETAAGEPDPTAPTETVTADGAVIVVYGFPETPADGGAPGDGGMRDPTGGDIGIDVTFPTPVVVTDIDIGTDPKGDVSISIDGTPGSEPDVPGTSPHPPRTPGTKAEPVPPDSKPPGTGKRPWACCLVALLGMLLVVTGVAGYGLGWLEPWLPRQPLITVAVVVFATLAILFLWWWACRCGCRSVVATWWARVRAPRAYPAPRERISPVRGGDAALEVLRQYGRPIRARAAAPVAAGQPQRKPTYWAPRAALEAAGRAARAAGAAATHVLAAGPASAAVRASETNAHGSVAKPGVTPGLPRGKVADRVSIRGSRVKCGTVTYVDLGAWRRYAEAIEVNAQRADLRRQYGTIVLETLTDDAFLLRPDSHYRLRFSLTKSGRSSASTEPHDSDTTDLEFWTQPAPPPNLGPYVLAPTPETENFPLFRAEETGVRMIETYLRQMFERVAGMTLTILISDTKGSAVAGRPTEWRKAEDHVDRTGQLAYLTQVNAIYGTAITPSALPRDDVLVAVPGSETAGILPSAVTLEATIVATGPGAPGDPLYGYRFRTSVYRDLADWAAALPRAVGSVADPGLPDALWAGTQPLSISEATLLPFLKEATPETPLLRRMSRVGRPPILILSLPEPLPSQRVELVLWEPAPPGGGGGAGGAGGAGGGGAPRRAARQEVQMSSHHVAYEAEYVVPLSRFKGPPPTNGTANPLTRLQDAKVERRVNELNAVPGPPPGPRQVPIRVVWMEDGSRAFIVPTAAAERIAAGSYDFEVRYAHPLPDAAGNRVVDTVTLRMEIPTA